MNTPVVWIGFSTTNSFVSRIIRWVTRGKCSHAWVRYWDSSLEQHMVLQAELHGFETIPWKRWVSKNKVVGVFSYVTRDLMPEVRYIGQYLGVDYDLKSAILTGLKRWFRKKFLRPVNSPGSLMCSEAVCRMLQKGSVDCVADLNPELVSPKELMDRVAKSSDFVQVQQVE